MKECVVNKWVSKQLAPFTKTVEAHSVSMVYLVIHTTLATLPSFPGTENCQAYQDLFQGMCFKGWHSLYQLCLVANMSVSQPCCAVW